MTDEQRDAAREISAGRRGAVFGPFIPALRSPEFMRRLQRLGEYLRYDQTLPPRLRELTILLTARHWSQEVEWHIHAPLALEAGVARDVVESIAEGLRPSGLSAEEDLLYDLFEELQQTRTVSDETYAAAVERFGEQVIVDLVGTIGYYSLLAMLMNTAQTPLPEGGQPVFGPA